MIALVAFVYISRFFAAWSAIAIVWLGAYVPMIVGLMLSVPQKE